MSTDQAIGGDIVETDELADRERRSALLGQRFGVASVDIGRSSLDTKGGAHVSLDKSSGTTAATITLPPGGSIKCDPAFIAGNRSPNIVVYSGAGSWFNPWRRFQRWMAGESSVLRTYFNEGKEPATLTLRAKNKNVVAVNLSKVPDGAIKTNTGAFMGSIADPSESPLDPYWSWKPWFNTWSGDRAFKQKIKGDQVVLLEASGSIGIDKTSAQDGSWFQKSNRSLLRADRYLASSDNLTRGLGWTFNPISWLIHSEPMMHMKLKNGTEKDGFFLTMSERRSRNVAAAPQAAVA